MSNASSSRFDVVVVGAGPAGMAAACCAAEHGVRTALLDENGTPGGQIWRGEEQHPTDSEFVSWRDRLRKSAVSVLSGLRAFDRPSPGILLAEGPDEIRELHYGKLVLATGARERFLPFPGWTLRNVVGAGGLQALVKQGLPIDGKRVVVAGTGPLLLAVAAYLRKKGAVISSICEQASWSALARFGAALVGHPGKIMQGLWLRRELSGVPFHTSSWPVAVEGDDVVKSVTISRRGRQEKIACDYLACGFHLVPNTELPMLLGCGIQEDFVTVDEFQRATIPDVFCAGEPTGIGGVELSLLEGQIAGLTAAGCADEARKLFSRRARMRRFARSLEQAFRLRGELQHLATDDTIICRCEDVIYSRLVKNNSWRSAKLQTRCGMGPCQGRVCGPATQFLFRWTPDSVRPPASPVRVKSLMQTAKEVPVEHSHTTGALQ